MNISERLEELACRVGERLIAGERQVVFAESCTGGLISAALAGVPGISNRLCGSAVVYQIETKAEWLGIEPAILEEPGPVSRIVAEQMAAGVLANTPQADVAASITGHLGPGARPTQDGLIYCAVAERNSEPDQPPKISVHQHRIEIPTPADGHAALVKLRHQRQYAAAIFVLERLAEMLDGSGAIAES